MHTNQQKYLHLGFSFFKSWFRSDVSRGSQSAEFKSWNPMHVLLLFILVLNNTRNCDSLMQAESVQISKSISFGQMSWNYAKYANLFPSAQLRWLNREPWCWTSPFCTSLIHQPQQNSQLWFSYASGVCTNWQEYLYSGKFIIWFIIFISKCLD